MTCDPATTPAPAVHGRLPLCNARSKLATPREPSSYFICTNDPGHAGDHTACDGRGHVMARWHSAVSKIEIWLPGGKAVV